jgi:phosphate transport system permease protein
MTAVETAMTDEQRREFVQATARRTLLRRRVWSIVFFASIGLAMILAFIPLFSIVYSVVLRGWHYMTWTFLTTPIKTPPTVFSSDIGGISNAITGTILIAGLALLIAAPLSIGLAIVLYELRNPFTAAFQRVLEVMIGLPSILFGIFIFTFVVTKNGPSGLAGSLALGMLMLPVITIATLAALRDVPSTLNEAALSLGARKSRVMWRVILPYSVPRIFTGIVLALGRAVGETAPVLLIIGGSYVTSWNPLNSQTNMPLTIFQNLQNTNHFVKDSTWGIALVLIVSVFCLNLIGRLVVARTQKGRV